MDKEEILEKYRNILVADSAKARNLIRKLDYKEDPFLLQCIAQTYLDESRFDENNKPRKELNQRKWKMAEKYTIKAFILDPECPHILSAMGSLRRSSGQNDIAIYCYKKVIKLGIKAATCTTYDFHTDFIKELINDAKFELYRLYFDDNPKLSEKYLAMYRKGLEKGINTIYRPLKRFLLSH